MNILLIEDDPQSGEMVKPILSSQLKANIVEKASLQDGIEYLEGNNDAVDLVICDYHGTSTMMVKLLFNLVKNKPLILVIDEKNKLEELLKSSQLEKAQTVDRKFLIKELLEKIELLKKENTNGDSEVVRLSPEEEKSIQSVDKKLDEMNANPEIDPEAARDAIEESLDVVINVSGKMGFSPQIQTIATKTVQLSLKVVGAKPRLKGILQGLQRRQGKYITSHSLMLAEMSCAIACQLGWNSAPTFLKLTLSSFLHDLYAKNNVVAQYRTIEEAKLKGNLTVLELTDLKMHPIKAAEFAQRFHEIPPDVDTIIKQHHEKPDGTGFPRGLFHRQIAPLAALFIVAEDMLHFFLDHTDATVSDFVLQEGEKYQVGGFRKIIKALDEFELSSA